MTSVAGISRGTQDRIRAIILEELELEDHELTDTGHFADDYDADSLTMIAIAARIEKELKIVVPVGELRDMTTLEVVFAVVGRYAGAEQPGE